MFISQGLYTLGEEQKIIFISPPPSLVTLNNLGVKAQTFVGLTFSSLLQKFLWSYCHKYYGSAKSSKGFW